LRRSCAVIIAVFNIAYRLTGNRDDAEDLTQEAFIRAFRFFDRYNRDMPFENWMYRIVNNAFIDMLRRRPKLQVQSLDQPLNIQDSDRDVQLEIPDAAANPETIVMSEELEDYIQRALDALPPDFRATVILADIQGLSYEEIAEAMHCSLGTVRSRLHRGRRFLRQRIEAYQQAKARGEVTE
jgi:RNA polymerase sigma-70 factor (ECF subfamily)